MRLPRKLARSFGVTLFTLFTLGCRKAAYTPPETPMPSHTILLSQMMRQLSAQPGFTEALIHQLDSGGKKGPALLTPKLIDELRNLIVGKNWAGLDRFPGWSMREINPTVRVVGHYAGKNEELEADSAIHPGTPLSATQIQAQSAPYLDLGPYALNKAETVSLDQPSTLAPFTTVGLVTQLSDDITRGDGPNDLAKEHAESQRLADILNRLAANKLEDVQPFTATIRGEQATTLEALIQQLQSTGHTVTVTDTRYFANFAHIHYKGEDVMAPFWINSKLKVPHTGGLFQSARPLLIPVSHAELEWHVRSPQGKPGINADISYYFGIDGKSQWRTMDTLDQAWVLKRDAHTYTGPQAVEATRLAGLLTVAYMHLHAAYPSLPFGGYYALGVCQDGVSAIEHALTGHVTLFPNTADETFFADPRDSEINALFHAIPKDRDGDSPTPDRIFGSLPITPAPNTAEPFAAITIPGLATDLNATYAAWQQGKLEGQHNWRAYLFGAVSILLLLLATRISATSKRDHRRDE